MSNRPKVVFTEEDHSYVKDTGEHLTSVTTVLKSIFPFDKDYWLTYGALKEVIGEEELKKLKREKYSSYKDKIQPPVEFLNTLQSELDPLAFFQAKDQVASGWAKKAGKGTKLHNANEKLDIERGYSINPFTEQQVEVIQRDRSKYDNYSQMDNLYDLEDGCHLELLVWNKYWSGQIDRIFIETIEDDRFIWVNDYKTDSRKPSHFTGYANPPLDHLQLGSLNKHTMQFSLYAYMLVQLGYKVGGLSLTWVKDFDMAKSEVMQVPYLEDECKILEEWYIKRMKGIL